jgi:nucleotidyltransferase/DNA polymerase involved in DNA repair
MPLRASRCIIHIDLDAFYAQVESKRLGLSPDTPLCVQQWNSLIAVNYAARALGISRFGRASEIRSKFPQCVLAHCATVGAEDNGKECAEVDPAKHKISLERYRVASAAIFEVFASAGCLVERASIDEAYFDVSSLVSDAMANGGDGMQQPISSLPPIAKDFVSGFHVPKSSDCNFVPQLGWVVGALSPDAECDTRIAVAAAIAAQLRFAVFSTLGYTCSAGVAHSKLLAKLGSAMHKPSGQTIIPLASVGTLMRSTPLQTIRYFGGKLGNLLKAGGFNTAGDVMQGDRHTIAACVGDDSVSFVLEVCSGELEESVTPRGPPSTMLASKSFLQPLHSLEECSKWLRVLACELVNRHQKDEGLFDRMATKLTVYYRSQYTHPSVANRSNSTPAMKLQASGDTYFCNRTGQLKNRTSSGSSHVCSLSPRGGIIDTDCIIAAATTILTRVASSAFPCKHLALTLSGFVAREGKRDITSFFGAMAAAAAATAAATGCGSGGSSPARLSECLYDAAATSEDDDQLAVAACDDVSDMIVEPGAPDLNTVALCSHSTAMELASAAAAPPTPAPSSHAQAAVVEKLATAASGHVAVEDDECVIIEPLSTAAASSLSVSAPALRQTRCPQCSAWLVGDASLRLHMDEHIAHKFQVLASACFYPFLSCINVIYFSGCMTKSSKCSKIASSDSAQAGQWLFTRYQQVLLLLLLLRQQLIHLEDSYPYRRSWRKNGSLHQAWRREAGSA